MTASLIAPVIPPARRAGRAAAVGGAGRPMPLAASVPYAVLPPGVLYGSGRIDRSGRVADSAVTVALGWGDGDRLTMIGTEAVVIARRDPDGMVTLVARACIAIPAALRLRCGLQAGDRVLLAALLDEDALAAYPMAVVDQAIRAHRQRLPAPGSRP